MDGHPSREFFTTNTPTPTAYLENTAEASATMDEPEESDESDALCYTCNDRVEEAKNMINAHAEIIKRKNLFIIRQSRRKKPSQKYSESNKQLRSNDRRAIRDQDQNNTSTTVEPSSESPQSSISSRTLNDAESRYTIVSRLRVRSADDSLAPKERIQPAAKKDKATLLMQMDLEEKLHLNETCKSLYRVDECLKDIQDKCLGDLQYHTLESVVEQWIKRIKCEWRLTGKKEWTGLTNIAVRKNPDQYMAIARPISAPDMVSARLNKLFGHSEPSSSSPRPTVGVELKPTLTQSGSERFNTIQTSAVQLKGSALYSRQSPKYYTENSKFMPLTSQLLIIPCVLVGIIIILTITRYFI